MAKEPILAPSKRGITTIKRPPPPPPPPPKKS